MSFPPTSYYPQISQSAVNEAPSEEEFSLHQEAGGMKPRPLTERFLLG